MFASTGVHALGVLVPSKQGISSLVCAVSPAVYLSLNNSQIIWTCCTCCCFAWKSGVLDSLDPTVASLASCIVVVRAAAVDVDPLEGAAAVVLISLVA